MATKINFPYGGTNYCLEYTKATVKTMEDKGFSPRKILEAPVTYLPELFRGAFLAHHPYTNRRIIDEIFEKMTDKSELMSLLIEMYNEPIKALTEENEDPEGNGIQWERA